MPKTKTKKSFVRPVHLQALLFLIIYFLVSSLVVANFLARSNVYVSFFGSFSFGLVSVFVFLYLFSHQDFFLFFKKLAKTENKKEKLYLGNYKQYGKLLACVLVSLIGGQIFLALTIRFLFSKSVNRYIVAFVSTLIATVISVFFGRSILTMFHII